MSRDDLPWERDADAPWEGGGLLWDSDTDEADGWRGEAHLRDWPEELAGPEYWLYKRMRDE